MRHEVLAALPERELDDYALACGIDISEAEGIEDKVAIIEKRRERVVDLEVLGLTLRIPVRRLRDKRLNDLLRVRRMTSEQAEEFMRQIIGEEQLAKVMDRVTDEDGVVDVDAYGMVIARVLTDGDLKNF